MLALLGLLLALVLSGLVVRSWCPFLGHDVRVFCRAAGLALRTWGYSRRQPPVTLLDVFLQRVRQQPDKALLLFQGRPFTYSEMDRHSNRLARVLQGRAPLHQGDCVAVLLSNQPLFVSVWLALAKLGCSVAFLNFNIRARSLLHCLQCCTPRVLIVGQDLRCLVEDVLPSLREENVTVLILDEKCTTESIGKDEIQAASDQPLPLSLRSHVTFKTPFVYIYTSGTTGLPKAAIITHARVHRMVSFIITCGIQSNDVIYTTLPLYHSAGSLIGVCGSIYAGATVVLRQKFSASQFWDDCRKYDVTVIQYIGEVLRYLCNSPKKSNDRDHKVRMALGNGARPDVWKEFLNRFGNIQVCEFYGATEGNVGFFNSTGKIGASGRISVLTRMFMPFHLVKYDVDWEAPVRDANGHCIEVAKGETGLLIAKITAKSPFIGYAGNNALTNQKHLRDVFCKGDLYFNSGDLMMLDNDNFIYFKDRIGDTFRWKGENVSTTEVADILSVLDFIQEVCVYGVTVPGHEGRIGMAAIQMRNGRDLDGEQLYEYVRAQLPSYAWPWFVREQKSLETTGTFKYYKVALMKEGFNPMTVQEPLYVLDKQKGTYIPLDQELYNSIIAGQVKL
ncbi:long-chain fatty acid transport protein 2-like [Hemiscyllium ocellatum]|uniref:long-chain fatty acid transport protein 2-like n=1 Tax=Hemiscyllium ocellatum TaxID=170820 RepID=UPI00296614B0|nr:long-chain fatty acid transport protein 2-like [Hemiscyllium ocellatum]